MQLTKPVKAIFFDIGNTLGRVDLASKTLAPFPEMVELLRTVRRVFGVFTGVITDIPKDWETADVEMLLRGAGVFELLSAGGIVTSKDARIEKKDGPEIFLAAAQRAGVEPEECFFIDDSSVNVLNACAAGMAAVQKIWQEC